MDATLKKNPHTRQRPSGDLMQEAVYDRGKNMQDPPIAEKSMLLIDKQSVLWTQPMV